MDALLLLILAIFWIPIWVVRRELAWRRQPDYWRRWGAVVLTPTALQQQERVIGRYMGVEIFEQVRFGGCTYRFERVAPSADRDSVGGGELFLEPGLVYRMEDSLTSTRSE